MRHRHCFSPAYGAGLLSLWVALLIFSGVGDNTCTASTNPIPRSWSFEGLADGAVLVATNGMGSYGWTGSPAAAAPASVLTTNYAWSDPYPLSSETHTNVMSVRGQVASAFEREALTNVWVDFMIKTAPVDEYPDFRDGAQVGLCFSTNRRLAIMHAWYSHDYTQVFRDWTELAHPPVASGEWARITVEFDYYTGQYSSGEHFFRVWFNGMGPITNAMAYTSTTPPQGGGTPDGGSWFLCADSGLGGFGPNHRYFSTMRVDGTCLMDDVIVAATGTFGEWDPDADPDGDGAPNWMEFAAGTDAARKGSYFCVLAQGVVDGSNAIAWYGTTNSGVYTPFMILRCTNPVSGAWVPVISNLQRDAYGTNIWIDTTHPPEGVPLFYRPAIPEEWEDYRTW